MTSAEDVVAEIYEPGIHDARSRYVSNDAFRQLLDPGAFPAFLDRFLIEFCSMGVHMTEPVERWIRGAGRRCAELGLEDLGEALDRHAEHEAGHHLMMVDDTRALVAIWNGTSDAPLVADELLERPPSPGCQAYILLHEETIASLAPWGQLAIEFEIERLSITAGRALMSNVASVCGSDRVKSLSFLTDHIALDEGHTVLNRLQLNRLLAAHPEYAEDLVRSGSAALDAHAEFIADCVAAAS